jgi:hypothetical protein
MTKIKLTKTHQNSPEIRQSRLKRDWMDETYRKHAYKCMPMSSANVSGWELVLQQDVVVKWDGTNTPPKVLEGEFLNGRPVVIPSIIGIISFATGWAINTEEGYDTWVTGSPNYFVDGAVPLSATIPSYWWPDEFNMNWKITKVNEPVVFKAGEPFMFFSIYPNNLLQSTTFEVQNLWDKPDLITARQSYGDAKMKKNIDEPWSWMNGIRTGLDENGNRIGPATIGLPKLDSPYSKLNEMENEEDVI